MRKFYCIVVLAIIIAACSSVADAKNNKKNPQPTQRPVPTIIPAPEPTRLPGPEPTAEPAPEPSPEPTAQPTPVTTPLPPVTLPNPYDWQKVTDRMPTATLPPTIHETENIPGPPEPLPVNDSTPTATAYPGPEALPAAAPLRVGFPGLALAVLALLGIGCAGYIIFLTYAILRK